MAWDFLTCLGSWSDKKVEVFLDAESLDSVQSPVNLKVHHHEELVARTAGEIETYDAIMAKPYAERIDSLKTWYQHCIGTLERKARARRHAQSSLDFEALCSAINSAKNVLFMGGASLGLLKRFIDRGIASKIHCHLQAVCLRLHLPPPNSLMGKC